MIKESEIKVTIDNYINNELQIIDFHTHLFPKSFQEFSLNGIENILNYHYLHAEYLKLSLMKPIDFFKLSSRERAKNIWQELFIKRIPFSEATKGVLTILNKFNISLTLTYDELERYFLETDSEQYISKIYKLSNIEKVVMTNDIFDSHEIQYYRELDKEKFYTSIRLDSYFDLQTTTIITNNKSFDLSKQLTDYLEYMIEFLKPIYFAISVDDKFSLNDDKYIFMEKYIFPLSKKYIMPVSLMIGVKRQVNPIYGLAGDTVINYDIENLEKILQKNQDIKFCVTMLSRENQYELTVLSRKFQNLLLFGNWWFLNNDIFINEITRMRMNLLGNVFIPQHSDARVLEHLVYKWRHTNQLFKDILFDYFKFLFDIGYELSRENIENSIDNFYNGEVRKLIEENKCITY
jgi:hypothetical protein